MSKEILLAIQESNAKLDRLISIMTKEQSHWVDPDEAADILGFAITKSGSHRRRVRWLIDQGYITQYRRGKPFMYWREQLELISKKIAKGEIKPTGRI